MLELMGEAGARISDHGKLFRVQLDGSREGRQRARLGVFATGQTQGKQEGFWEHSRSA